jgi:hypothetical protein
MAERLVKLAGIGFRDAQDTVIYVDGQKREIPQAGFGMRGQTVDVHEDDLERFDMHNDQYDEVVVGPESAGPEDNQERRMGPVVANPSTTDHPLFPAGPDPLDHGVGGDIKRPDRRANVSEWRDYAERLGVEDVDDKTKRELIEETQDLEDERAEQYRQAAEPQEDDDAEDEGEVGFSSDVR